MPIHTLQNQYQGVNAHLHSYFQQKSGWETFHSDHITYLREAVNKSLPRGSGYFALTERSIQLAYYDSWTDELISSRMRPDISIIKTGQQQSPVLSQSMSSPTAVLPLELTLLEPEYLNSVTIVKGNTLVTRIELLSPANKPIGSHYETYILKRNETLAAGINLVEIDYLHESRSPVTALADYTNHAPKSYPYTILVSEPAAHKRILQVYGFRVDEPIPSVALPLLNNDTVSLNFGTVYHHTFNTNDYFGLHLVDYQQLPLNFESYHEEDQQRIKAVMERVKTLNKAD